MTEQERKAKVEEISDLEGIKYKIAEFIHEKRREAVTSCSEIRPALCEKRVKPEDIFGNHVSPDQYYIFYEVERAYFREDQEALNPRFYWLPPIGSEEEADDVLRRAKDGDVNSILKAGDAQFKAGNYEEAFSWFAEAAKMSYSDGLVKVGELLLSGKGTEKDLSKAIWAFEMAIAIDANSDALKSLGICYVEGLGVENDTEKGLSFLVRSALQGNASAMIYLANMSLDGHGVEKDLEEAKHWYEFAATGCSGIAYHNLMEILHEEKKYELMKPWTQMFMNMGHPRAFYNAGFMFYYGEGVEEDKSQGIDLIRQAADMNDPSACYSLSKVLGPTDVNKGWEYFKKAFGLGLPEAEFEMGTYFWKDEREEALEYIRRAAEKGYERAIAFLREHSAT